MNAISKLAKRTSLTALVGVVLVAVAALGTVADPAAGVDRITDVGNQVTTPAEAEADLDKADLGGDKITVPVLGVGDLGGSKIAVPVLGVDVL